MVWTNLKHPYFRHVWNCHVQLGGKNTVMWLTLNMWLFTQPFSNCEVIKWLILKTDLANGNYSIEGTQEAWMPWPLSKERHDKMFWALTNSVSQPNNYSIKNGPTVFTAHHEEKTDACNTNHFELETSEYCFGRSWSFGRSQWKLHMMQTNLCNDWCIDVDEENTELCEE